MYKLALLCSATVQLYAYTDVVTDTFPHFLG